MIYLIVILGGIGLFAWLVIRQTKRDNENRRAIKEGRATKRFWRDMP